DDHAVHVLHSLAVLHAGKGDAAKAKQYGDQAGRLSVAAENMSGVVHVAGLLSRLAEDANQLDEAERHAAEGLTLARRVGDRIMIASMARHLASIRLKQERLDDADELLREAE